MEIREILSHFVNTNTSHLEVDFRIAEDSDDLVRTDSITFKEIKEFGFDFINELEDIHENFSDDEEEYTDEDDFLFNFDETIDLDEVKSFLDEYYMVYPDRLPKAELF